MLDYKKIAQEGRYGEYFRQVVEKIIADSETFEDVLDNGLREICENLAESEGAAGDLCDIVKRLGSYTSAQGGDRRSHRSSDVRDYTAKISSIAYSALCDWEKFDLIEWLATNNSERRSLVAGEESEPPDYLTMPMLIALKIDRQDKPVIDAVTDLILSENNTRALDYQIITGVAMSSNEELHALMQKLLLAAKLQEGLRQAILETADDGTLNYFKMIIKTVLEHNLLRFSSVLRAVCVWMGLGYDYSDRRVAEKMLKLGYEYIESGEKRAEAIGSADVAHMFAAMWAESVCSPQNLGAHIERCMSGEKYQKLVGAYFLNETQNADTRIRLAGDALRQRAGVHDGARALHILPVHSQHRGRVFLPFLDEDPKTAEIVSKILMLAEDGKIKDPAVMSQIGKG